MQFVSLNRRLLPSLEVFLIIVISAIPLLLHFPYRVNIFLSWEGAYRLYLGQVPYRDFGLPMGVGFWLLPALFFKVFGPSMLSLIKAQVLLNIMGAIAFRGILRRTGVPPGVRLAAVLTFCLSYILVNFWPWYNNTDILYGIVGLDLLLGAQDGASRRYLRLAGSAVFLFLSFFTKQDGGFLMVALAAVLVLYPALIERKWKDAGLFFLFFTAISLVVILPLSRYSFGYWFNHGQPPHTARLSVRDILSEFLGASQWIKLYLGLIALLVLAKVQRRSWKVFFLDRKEMRGLILTLGILGTAAIFQVTSYTPPDNNIFFHAFAIAYILTGLTDLFVLRPEEPRTLIVLVATVLLWWSGAYWKSLERLTVHIWPAPPVATVSPTGENVINKNTYVLNLDTTHYEDESTWIEVPGMPSFRKIYLPPSTVAGMERVKERPEFAGPSAHVLNMSELTPLARELGFTEDKGPMEPLWYHLGVCMFNREADTVCGRIARSQYDAVLFEYVPNLNNFYPFRVRDTLRRYYALTDSFLAPRRPTTGYVEVYLRKKP